MPTYLYECSSCGRFEEFQKITDDPLEECPKCGEPVRRIIGSPGIIFKGSGFYSTDNGSSSVNGTGAKSNNNSTATEKTDNKSKNTDNDEKAS